MKKHLVLLLFGYVCWGQSPIYPLIDAGEAKVGAYYKDLDNELDPFVGTWLYTSGNNALTVTLQKKVMAHIDIAGFNYYEDTLIGEYKYVENGVIKINTLPQMQLNIPSYNHNITDVIILRNNPLVINISFDEPGVDVVGLAAVMIMRREDSGSVQKLKVNFRMSEAPVSVNGVSPQTTYTLPYGEYILTKQP